MTHTTEELRKLGAPMSDTTPESALLPCPFCGGEATVFGPVGWYRQYGITHSCRVFFGGSGDFTIGGHSKEQAISNWNTRSSADAALKRIVDAAVQAEREACAAEAYRELFPKNDMSDWSDYACDMAEAAQLARAAILARKENGND